MSQYHPETRIIAAMPIPATVMFRLARIIPPMNTVPNTEFMRDKSTGASTKRPKAAPAASPGWSEELPLGRATITTGTKETAEIPPVITASVVQDFSGNIVRRTTAPITKGTDRKATSTPSGKTRSAVPNSRDNASSAKSGKTFSIR